MITTLVILALAQAPTLGINAGGNAPYETGKMLVDQMATAGPWVTSRLDAAGKPIPAKLGPAGWPIEDASCRMFLNVPPAPMRLSMQGTGTPSFVGHRTVTITPTEPVGTTATADVVAAAVGSPVNFALTGIDPANPPHDIHLIAPGYDPASPPRWRVDFTRRFGIFPGGVRLMALMACNDSTKGADWAARVLPGRSTYTTADGLPYEWLIELLNTIKPVYAWINIPDRATDDYSRSMAALFAATLDPSIGIKLEFSNELWNIGFTQYASNITAAKADPRFTGTPDAAKGCERSITRAIEHATIWRAAFGPGAARIKMVFAGQSNSKYWVNHAINYSKAVGLDLSQIDVVAIAPYVNVPAAIDLATAPDSLTLDALFDGMTANLSGVVAQGIADHAALARSIGATLEAYEGGQGLVDVRTGAGGAINHTAKAGAQTDPRMATLMSALFKTWSDAGGGTFMVFGPPASLDSPYGYWGQMSTSDAHGSVKWDHLLSRILVPGDCNLDGRCDFDDYLNMRLWSPPSGRAWREDGDLDGDGSITPADVTAWGRTARITDSQRARVATDFPTANVIMTAP